MPRATPAAAEPRLELQSASPVVLSTKLHVPATAPNFVPRPRLAEQLTNGLTRGVVLVTAPALLRQDLDACRLGAGICRARRVALGRRCGQPRRPLLAAPGIRVRARARRRASTRWTGTPAHGARAAQRRRLPPSSTRRMPLTPTSCSSSTTTTGSTIRRFMRAWRSCLSVGPSELSLVLAGRAEAGLAGRTASFDGPPVRAWGHGPPFARFGGCRRRPRSGPRSAGRDAAAARNPDRGLGCRNPVRVPVSRGQGVSIRARGWVRRPESPRPGLLRPGRARRPAARGCAGSCARRRSWTASRRTSPRALTGRDDSQALLERLERERPVPDPARRYPRRLALPARCSRSCSGRGSRRSSPAMSHACIGLRRRGTRSATGSTTPSATPSTRGTPTSRRAGPRNGTTPRRRAGQVARPEERRGAADRARIRGARARSRRPNQPADRRRAVHHHRHGQAPRDPSPRQARRAQPH